MLRTRLRGVTFTDIVVWLIGLIIFVGMIWGSIATIRLGKYSASTWTDLIVTGLALGGVYALIARNYLPILP